MRSYCTEGKAMALHGVECHERDCGEVGFARCEEPSSEWSGRSSNVTSHSWTHTAATAYSAVQKYWYSVNVSHCEFMKCILLINRLTNSRIYWVVWVVWVV